MQSNKALKKTSKAAEKSAITETEKMEALKGRAAKSSRTKKSEGTDMTSGKSLHKPATPAISTCKSSAESAANSKLRRGAKSEPASTPKAVSHAEIAKLAYSYWLERGCTHGYAEEDWLRAERELTGR